MAEFMEVMQDLEDVRNLRAPRVRISRERINAFTEFSDEQFRKRYRLTKKAVTFVVNLIRAELEPRSKQAKNVSPELQVLTTLRFFAKGCYQTELGDLHGLSQSSVSRIIKKVSRALASKLHLFVKWPQRLNLLKEGFFNVAGLPGIIGCIDCTHIKIKNPDGQNPMIYCNRKGFYSLNVQVVCDHTTRILDIVAKWRGSAHDSRIFNCSRLKQDLEGGSIKGILLGDSGYACTKYMLTPLLNTNTAPQRAYNLAHKTTRVIVECCFGRWKGMFKALKNDMQINLESAKTCVAAMAVLYNIKLDFDDNFEYDDEDENSDEDEDSINENLQPVQADGNLFRRNFIAQHFNI